MTQPLKFNITLEWLTELREVLYSLLPVCYKEFRFKNSQWTSCTGQGWDGEGCAKRPHPLWVSHPPRTPTCSPAGRLSERSCLGFFNASFLKQTRLVTSLAISNSPNLLPLPLSLPSMSGLRAKISNPLIVPWLSRQAAPILKLPRVRPQSSHKHTHHPRDSKGFRDHGPGTKYFFFIFIHIYYNLFIFIFHNSIQRVKL